MFDRVGTLSGRGGRVQGQHGQVKGWRNQSMVTRLQQDPASWQEQTVTGNLWHGISANIQ